MQRGDFRSRDTSRYRTTSNLCRHTGRQGEPTPWKWSMKVPAGRGSTHLTNPQPFTAAWRDSMPHSNTGVEYRSWTVLGNRLGDAHALTGSSQTSRKQFLYNYQHDGSIGYSPHHVHTHAIKQCSTAFFLHNQSDGLQDAVVSQV